MKQAIFSDNAPTAIGPYSQAISAGDTLYISGQLPIDPATGSFPSEDIKDQTKMSLENINAILAAAGLTMANVVKTTVLLLRHSFYSFVASTYVHTSITDGEGNEKRTIRLVANAPRRISSFSRSQILYRLANDTFPQTLYCNSRL